jgi:hypothetical protein
MGGVDAAGWPAILGGVRGAAQRKTRLPLSNLGLRPLCAERFALHNRLMTDRSRDIEGFQAISFPHGASGQKCQ